MAGSAEYLIARKKFLLSGLDLAKLRGLEIGALASPMVEKNEGPIHYVDHATTADLITKYAGQIDPKRIRNVDYVWSPEAQLSSVVENEKFDYIVASHVIEHVPDVIGWINQLSECLSPGGVLCLAVPDKRYTFDIARPLSTLGEMIQSFYLKSELPSIKQVWDNYTLARNVSNGNSGSGYPYLHSRAAVWELLSAIRSGQYVDCHCWIFTPRSFVDAFEALAVHKLISVVPVWIQSTIKGEHEFLVRLQKLDATGVMPNLDEIKERAAGEPLDTGL